MNSPEPTPSNDRSSAEEFVLRASQALLGRPTGPMTKALVRHLIETPADHGWVLRKLVASTEFRLKWGTLGSIESAPYSMEKDPALQPFMTTEIMGATRASAAHSRWSTEAFLAFAMEALGNLPSVNLKGRQKYFGKHRERFRELLNCADYLLEPSKDRAPQLLEVGGSIFSVLLKKAFPRASIDIMDQRKAEFLGPFTRQHFLVNLETVVEPVAVNAGCKYDIVFFSEVLEHLLANPVRVLRFLLEQVDPSGYLVMTTPNYFKAANLRKTALRQNPQPIYSETAQPGRDVSYHVREYCMSELLQFCCDAGGKVFAFRFSSCWDTPEATPDLPVDQLRNLFVVAQRGS